MKSRIWENHKSGSVRSARRQRLLLLDPIVGETLSVELLPTQATATYQWQISETMEGPFVDLIGITENHYTLQPADWGKFIRLSITGSGIYTGSFISDVKGPISTWAPYLGIRPVASPGSTPATTSITALANTSGSALAIKVSATSIERPFLGEVAPTGIGVTNPYSSGNNLGNVKIGDYVGVYSLSPENKVEAFSQIQLSDQIKAPPGYVYTVAGKKNYQGECGDWHYVGIGEPATTAGFDSPYGVTFDSNGNMYISSSNQHVIDVVPARDGMLWGQDMKAGHIYTVVGNYGLALVGDINAPSPMINGGYSGDGGPATEAWLNCPSAVAFDQVGNMYFADQYNHLVRMVAAVDQNKWGIDMQAGYIYTIAGEPSMATNDYVPLENRYGGDGGPALGAKLAYPSGVALDAAGNLYVADAFNHLVRMISISDQTLWGQSMQANSIYTIAGNYAVGNNQGAFSGDGGPANQAKLYKPWAVTVDSSGNLYIADANNNVVRVVAASNQNLWGIDMLAGNIYTVAGDYNFKNQDNWWNLGIGNGGMAAEAMLDFPCGVVLDSSGNLYIMDQQNFSIRMVSAYDQSKWGNEMSSGHIYSVVGNMDVDEPIQDGDVATAVDLDYPSALAINDEGDLFFANYLNMVYAASMIRSANVEVTASQSTPPIGEATSITVRVLDGIGKPLANRSVTLTADNGSSIITPMTSQTGADGSVIFSVTGSQAETVNYTVYAGTIPIGSIQLVFHE